METLQEALTALLTAVSAMAVAYLAKKVREWINSIKEEKARDAVIDAFTTALQWSYEKVQSGKVPTKAEILAGGVEYLYDHFPDYLKLLGLDPASVRTALEARFANVIGVSVLTRPKV